MAFALANFAPAGNSSKPPSGVTGPAADLKGAPCLWSYMTADTSATINTSGYFNEVFDLLHIGDLIFGLAGANSGGTLAPSIFVVLSKAASVVDVSNGEPITISDTD